MSKRRLIKPGLWLPTVKVEVEDVTTRHKKECCDCEGVPAERRLVVRKGSGRHGVTEIRCMECGVEWLESRLGECERAIGYLMTGKGCIRE